jgi:CspA family cold shock protein
MIWWLVVAAIGGVLGIANAILNRLRQTAAVERQRWRNEYQQLEREVVRYEQQIAQKVREAQYTVDFHQLTQLHYESMKTADHAYRLLSDARVALDAIGVAIRDAGREKNRLIAEKRRTFSPFKKSQLEQEISALIELRRQLFPDKDQLKAQRNRFHEQVKRLNAQTHALKNAIRDRCGPQGQDWYRRSEERTRRKKLGLPPKAGEARARGRVKWYDRNRGYGFIAPNDGGQDVHVGRKNLRGVRSLEAGDTVEFSIRYGKKGPWAFDVTTV